MTDRSPRKLRPSYLRAGLQASGTASDLRRLRIGLSKVGAGFQVAGPLRFSPRPLRILAHLSTYVPHSFGGSESSMQATLGFLRRQGHEARVIVDESPVDSYEVEGVGVVGHPGRGKWRELYRWAEVILTQGRSAVRSYMRSVGAHKPIVLFVRDIADWRRLPGPPDLLVFNAEWQMHAAEYSGASIVVHSPIEPAKYLTSPGDRVTLINLNARKGGQLFNDLVFSMPDIEFLAVVGVWGQQILPPNVPRNLEVVEAQSDVRKIYSRTRVLLVPSKWESFGRVAVEAGISGIPVIASPNPGTIEALGDAGIYARLTDLDDWARCIRSLDDPKIYQQRSAAVARAATRFIGPGELACLEAKLMDIASR